MLTESEFKLKHLLTKKEISAFRGEIPMNQSLFNKIVDKMMGRNMGEHTFDEFIIRHQEFLPEYNQQIEYDRFIGEDQEKYGIDPYLEP